MALTTQDVFDTLSSYYVTQMDFWVDSVHVCTRNFDKVRALIEDDDIHVVGGTEAQVAHYDSVKNTLITQNVAPPPSLSQRALLIHECTHAIVDVEKCRVTELTNEVAAYIAQLTFTLLGDPNFKTPPNSPDWFNFFRDTLALVKKFKLNRPEGRGARLRFDDFSAVRNQLHQLGSYRAATDRQMAYADGVTPAVRGRFGDTPSYYQQTTHESYIEAGDDHIVRLLAMRYDAKDVAGFGGRVKKLEDIFGHAEPIRAQCLLQRLQLRIATDKMSVFFHDHLSTRTRNSLLAILRARH